MIYCVYLVIIINFVSVSFSVKKLGQINLLLIFSGYSDKAYKGLVIQFPFPFGRFKTPLTLIKFNLNSTHQNESYCPQHPRRGG